MFLKKVFKSVFLFSFLIVSNVSFAEIASEETFFDLLKIHEVKKMPGPYDWMAHHPEPFQSFSKFVEQNPPKPDLENQKIYIQLIGDFDDKRKQIVDQSSQFISAFFGMKIDFLNPLPLSEIPANVQRINAQTKENQILSTYLIEEVLIPQVPGDAYSVIAFVSQDLWPGQGWNFVFGQASIDDRVGVWSIARNGDPNESEEAYQLCLFRTIKTGVHELGHMFGMEHCKYFECLMNGSNHRKETDDRPVYLCPVDMRKLNHLTEENLNVRYERLEKISREIGFNSLADFYQKSQDILNEGH